MEYFGLFLCNPSLFFFPQPLSPLAYLSRSLSPSLYPPSLSLPLSWSFSLSIGVSLHLNWSLFQSQLVSLSLNWSLSLSIGLSPSQLVSLPLNCSLLLNWLLFLSSTESTNSPVQIPTQQQLSVSLMRHTNRLLSFTLMCETLAVNTPQKPFTLATHKTPLFTKATAT